MERYVHLPSTRRLDADAYAHLEHESCVQRKASDQLSKEAAKERGSRARPERADETVDKELNEVLNRLHKLDYHLSEEAATIARRDQAREALASKMVPPRTTSPSKSQALGGPEDTPCTFHYW